METPPSSPLARVRAIVLDELRGRGARAWLFGSWARGTPSRGSDIDVAVEGADAPVLSRLRERLEESDVPYVVDVVDLGRCDPGFRRAVLQEAVPWTA